MGQIGNKVESGETCNSACPYPFLQRVSGQKDDVNGVSSFSDICFMLVYIFHVILRVNCLKNLCIDAREENNTIGFWNKAILFKSNFHHNPYLPGCHESAVVFLFWTRPRVLGCVPHNSAWRQHCRQTRHNMNHLQHADQPGRSDVAPRRVGDHIPGGAQVSPAAGRPA